MNPQVTTDKGREEGESGLQQDRSQKTEVRSEPEKQPTGPKPTIGRIVLYQNPVKHGKPELIPALVQNVGEDGSVRLHVFAAHLRKTVENVPQGDLAGQWSWPKRD